MAGGVHLGVRASLMEAKVFGRIREWMAARDAGAIARLDAVVADGWVDVDDHILMLEGAAAMLGLDALRELSRKRTRESAIGAIFPNIVQSWTRSFARDPVAVARIYEPLARACMRYAGELELVVGTGEVRTQWTHAPWLARSEAWRAHVLGTTQGIHDLAETGAIVSIAITGDDSVDLVVRWQN